MIAIVVIAGSLLYYFVFFQPEMQRQNLAFQKSQYELVQKEKQDNKQALEKALKEEDDNLANTVKSAIGKGLTTEDWVLLFKIHQDRVDNLFKQYSN